MISLGIDMLDQDTDVNRVALLLGALVVAGILNYVFYYLRSRLSVIIVGDAVSQMRKDAFAAAVNRDLSFYDENKSGKIVSRITSDTNRNRACNSESMTSTTGLALSPI